jgi:hypothetical protein
VSHRIRRTLTAAALAAAIQVPASAAFAAPHGAGGHDPLARDRINSAVSVNQTDGGSVFHLSFQIARATGEDVAVSNVAVALSECTSCQTVAIALQIDLISPVPAVLTATNTAIAANQDCVLCSTLAFAFQYVVATPDPVTLTERGKREVRRIERRLAGLSRLEGDPEELTADVQALTTDLSQVLESQLVPVGGSSGPGEAS